MKARQLPLILTLAVATTLGLVALFLFVGTSAACTAFVICCLMAILVWQASWGKEEHLLDPHVLRGPPDGCA